MMEQPAETVLWQLPKKDFGSAQNCTVIAHQLADSGKLAREMGQGVGRIGQDSDKGRK